ncbi:MAG: hypothetical protein HYY37_01225 [Candidatus Aenigmarchaeota archaeon]|nr:hypothetical protein [Candidatus Aenigmarchaeota archaeon]
MAGFLYRFITGRSSLKLVALAGALLFVVLALSNLVAVGVLMLLSFAVSAVISFLRVRSVGIELVTFATVITGVTHGPVAGAMVGLVLILFHVLAGQFIGEYVLWVIPGYVIAGFLAPSLGGGIAAAGTTVTLALNVINIMFTLLVGRQNLSRFLPYALTNVLFNWLLFGAAGQFIVAVLA